MTHTARVLTGASSTATYCRTVCEEAGAAAKAGEELRAFWLALHVISEQTAELLRLTEEIRRLCGEGFRRPAC